MIRYRCSIKLVNSTRKSCQAICLRLLQTPKTALNAISSSAVLPKLRSQARMDQTKSNARSQLLTKLSEFFEDKVAVILRKLDDTDISDTSNIDQLDPQTSPSFSEFTPVTVKEVKIVDVKNNKSVPIHMEVVNVQNGRSSTMKMEKIIFNPNVKDEYFTVSYLEK